MPAPRRAYCCEGSRCVNGVWTRHRFVGKKISPGTAPSVTSGCGKHSCCTPCAEAHFADCEVRNTAKAVLGGWKLRNSVYRCVSGELLVRVTREGVLRVFFK